MENQTIAAIATASGQGSISVIRVSGERACFCVSKIFYKRIKKEAAGEARINELYNNDAYEYVPFDLREAKTHTVHYGFIMDERVVDEVLVLIMRSPHSYTAEDVVEIHCHGGGFSANKILELLIKSGVRLAEPGEFTKRAYLNGRIDLTQAESVMDVIRAQSDIAFNAAQGHLGGDIKDRISLMREVILSDTAYLEAALDDPEHIELTDFESMLREHITQIEKAIDELIEASGNGRIISEGIKTAIVGRPNVGKSSFLNCILRDDRAIVTDIPGTTRDTLEEDVRVGRILLRLIDTAGIRSTDDEIEKIGVKKSKESIKLSDFVIFVADSADKLSREDEQILSECSDKPGVILLNKSDLLAVTTKADIEKLQNNTGNNNKKIIEFSSVSGAGLSELEGYLDKTFFNEYFSGNNKDKGEIFITNVRQKEALLEVKNSFVNLRETMDNKLPADLLTVDLMDAYTRLGVITGESVEDDLADKIFSEFCMGK